MIKLGNKYYQENTVFVLVFFSLFIFRLAAIYFSPLDLAFDEAHYYDWSKRLDWSYYSKGPFVAFSIALFTNIFGHNEFAVRFSALFWSSLAFFVYFRILKDLFDFKRAFIVSLLLFSSLIFSQISLIITTDPPALFFWIASLSVFIKIFNREKSKHWPIAFALLGFGFLSKYTVVILIPVVVFVLIVVPEKRRELLNIYFYLGLFVFSIFLAPIFIWNYQHDWVNFLHNAGHISGKKEYFGFKYFFELVLGQLGLLNIFLFVALIQSLFIGLKVTFKKRDATFLLLTLSSFFLLSLCVVLSFKKRIYANWPMLIYPPMGILLAYFLEQKKFLSKLSKLAIYVNAFLFLISHLVFFGFTFFLPVKILPTKKLVGWRTLAQEVEKIAEEKHIKPFFASESYQVASELAFYLKGKPITYNLNLDQRRMNQFDIWGGFENLKGQDLLLVTKNKLETMVYGSGLIRDFDDFSFEQEIDINYNESYLRTFYVYVGKGFKGVNKSNLERYTYGSKW